MEIISAEKRQFIEELARACEQIFGFSRMTGRIWAVLMIVDREHLSIDELMEYVGASRGSVSTLARMLERMGLAKRVIVRGDRRHYYRPADAEMIIQAEIVSMKTFIRLLHSGLRAAGGKGPARDRLTGLHDLMELFADEFAAIVDRWHRQRAEK
jgi:DNA-binding MarR family transcriptional regulator